MNVLPQQFIDMLASLPGHDCVAEALAESEPPTAIRLNPAKPLAEYLFNGTTLVPWEPMGHYLTDRPRFTFHPGLYDGRFYVQDPSAMIVGEIVRLLVSQNGAPYAYLDACAAPGGKTTSAIAALPEGSFVLSNEYERERAASLIENLERWGTGNYAVRIGDARGLYKAGEVFDIVNADVPCSGEGMMRKNEKAVDQWSPGLVKRCAELQREIVASVWLTLKPGGYFIYSTCTFNRTENEENAEWIRDNFGAKPVNLRLTDFPGVMPGVDTDIPCARFLPGKVRGEGQFVAVFQKPSDAGRIDAKATRKDVNVAKLPEWLKGDYTGLADKTGNIFAVSREWLGLVKHLINTIGVAVPGLHVATPKGRDPLPAHALATSLYLRTEAFPSVEVDYPTAMAFLRGEAIRFENDVPRGVVLVRNSGCALGWAKNIGNRANNLIPAGRRIRSSYVPDSMPELR